MAGKSDEPRTDDLSEFDRATRQYLEERDKMTKPAFKQIEPSFAYGGLWSGAFRCRTLEVHTYMSRSEVAQVVILRLPADSDLPEEAPQLDFVLTYHHEGVIQQTRADFEEWYRVHCEEEDRIWATEVINTFKTWDKEAAE